jgi:hypothetical protein
VPVKVVTERLGHATPSLSRDVYGWVPPGMQAEARCGLLPADDGCVKVR